MNHICRGVLHDFRYGLRQWQRAPWFTTIAVLVLALGMGATLALFGILDALVLRPLPVPEPDRLVAFSPADPKYPDYGNLWELTAFKDLSARQHVLEPTAAYFPNGVTVGEDGTFSMVHVAFVTGSYFDVLGLRPALGRDIGADDVEAAAHVAVMSHDYWKQQYSRDPGILGAEVRLQGIPFTVVGVSAPRFAGLEVGVPTEFTLPITSWRALAAAEGFLTDPNEVAPVTRGIGRLRQGMTLAQARQQLQTLWPGVRQQTAPPGFLTREQYLATTMDVSSAALGVSWNRDWHATPLKLLVASTFWLLLIACLNLASLMLARAMLRLHEVTIRAALGAPRWRLLRQGLIQGLLLSAAGTLAALPLAAWGGPVLLAMMRVYPDDLSVSLSPDWRVVAVAAGAALVVGVLVGLLPAWRASGALRCSRVSLRTMTTHRGWGERLLVLQVALALTLFTTAALFTRSLTELRNTDLGFNRESRLIVSLSRQPGRDADLDAKAYGRKLVDVLESIRGVQSVSFSDIEPVIGIRATEMTFEVAPADGDPGAGHVGATFLAVSPGYLRTMGVPLLAGREFDWTDDVAHQQVAVISAALAGRLFRAADPVGEWIRVNNSTNPRLGRVQIVGVSRDAKLADLHSREPQFIFMPILQASSQAGRTPTAVEIALSASSAAVQAPIRRAIESLGQDYVWRQSTLVDQVERSLLRERLLASGGYGFGALALIVVGLGICGVLASSVSARTREIGIRATLGATVGELQWMVLKQALRVAGLAILLGLPCVWLAGRTVAASLTGIRPHDSLSIAAAVAVAIGMCVAAAWLPARRAAAVSPMEALQTE